MQAVVALTRLGGVATHAELVDAVGRKRLRTALKAGLIRRHSRRVYVVAEADAARAAAYRLNGALGLTSAALAHGWKVKSAPAQPIVCVPRHREVDARRRHGVDVRWTSLTPDELTRRVSDPCRTVIDCARFLPFDEALAVADSALRARDVGARELVEAAELAPRTGRSRALRVAEHATRLAANPMESVLRAICLDIPGLDVSPQRWVGSVGRADLVEEGRRMVIEAESFEFHSTLAAYRRDVRRYTAFVREHYVVLRFCWEDIMLDPSGVRATIQDVLQGPKPLAVRRRTG